MVDGNAAERRFSSKKGPEDGEGLGGLTNYKCIIQGEEDHALPAKKYAPQ